MLLEAGQRVVGSVAGPVAARVHSLPGVVDLLVVLEMILPTKCSATHVAGEGFCLRVDENVPL